MQKDDRFYTFLFTHSSTSKIYIRRIEVSKKWLHTCAATAVLSIGLATAGIVGVMKTEGSQIAENTPNIQSLATLQAPIANQPVQINNEVKSINYERPADVSSPSTGGPATSFNLTDGGTDGDLNNIENEILNIERTSNPSFLPNMWAHMGKINNEFGFRRNPFGGRSYEFHGGLDIDGEKGDIVVAPANGVAVKAGWAGGYGNVIEIDHGNGLKTRYGHLSKVDIQVGDTVTRGQQIGLVGSTGRSTGPHLHYEVRLNDKAINPRRFLPPEMPK